MDRATCLAPRFRAIERHGGGRKKYGVEYPINNAVRRDVPLRVENTDTMEHASAAQCRREYRQELLVWYSYVDAYCLELFEGKRHHAPCNFVQAKRYWANPLSPFSMEFDASRICHYLDLVIYTSLPSS